MVKKTKNKELSKLGKNVKKFKKEKGYSKSELVRLTGLDYHTISKIESGITPNPTVGTVSKIAEALEKTVDDLIK